MKSVYFVGTHGLWAHLEVFCFVLIFNFLGGRRHRNVEETKRCVASSNQSEHCVLGRHLLWHVLWCYCTIIIELVLNQLFSLGYKEKKSSGAADSRMSYTVLSLKEAGILRIFSLTWCGTIMVFLYLYCSTVAVLVYLCHNLNQYKYEFGFRYGHESKEHIVSTSTVASPTLLQEVDCQSGETGILLCGIWRTWFGWKRLRKRGKVSSYLV